MQRLPSLRPAIQYAHGCRVCWRSSSSSSQHQPLTKSQLREFLSKPSWSVKSLQSKVSENPKITPQELHHLLRLSALPLPTSPEQESDMIKTLESQLYFVRAIQSVDTTGVEPLQSIRDETKEAQKKNEITLENLEEDLSKETRGGFAGRITKTKEKVDTSDVQTGDPLGQAPKKYGRYIVVNTKKA